MYNVEDKKSFLGDFIARADENLKVTTMFGDIKEAMKACDAAKVKYLVSKAVESVKASVADGLNVADAALYVNQSELDGVIKLVDVTIRNKYSSDYKFKFKKQLVLTEDVTGELYDFLKCAYAELITDAIVNANLEEVNEKLAEIGEKAGID